MNKLDDYIKTLPNATTSFNNSNIQIREINNHWGRQLLRILHLKWNNPINKITKQLAILTNSKCLSRIFPNFLWVPGFDLIPKSRRMIQWDGH